MWCKIRNLGFWILFCTAIFFITSCISKPEDLSFNAQKIAFDAFFKEQKISTKYFTILTYNKLKQNSKIANIYIEGDGNAFDSNGLVTLNPTPKNPLALKLAIQDSSDNLIYLGRPCQFTKNDKLCQNNQYWSNLRFAPEVIFAMNESIDKIKQQNKLEKFNLIGFSGGGGLAILIAARRNDISSIRTVAGNLDIKTHSSIHHVPDLIGSLNPIDFAGSTSHIPQIHFVGENDNIVPKIISVNFINKVANNSCVQINIVKNATHNKIWVDIWSKLLSIKLECKK